MNYFYDDGDEDDEEETVDNNNSTATDDFDFSSDDSQIQGEKAPVGEDSNPTR